MVRREAAEHEVGTRLKCNVVALLGRQREIFKMGLAVVARIYPYVHLRAPSHREIIVHTKAYSASSPTTKSLALLLRTLPPECQDFWTASRPLSTLQRSFPSVRRRPANTPNRPLAFAVGDCRAGGTARAHRTRARLPMQRMMRRRYALVRRVWRLGVVNREYRWPLAGCASDLHLPKPVQRRDPGLRHLASSG